MKNKKKLLPAPKMSIKEALTIARKVSELSPAEMTVRELTTSGALLVLANYCLEVEERS